MCKISELCPKDVFYYFSQICKIPRGSGNMSQISSFCEEFAKTNGLEYKRDSSDNVIIYKPASVGFENIDPIILQGHLDMVCQKTEDCKIYFEKDPLDIYIDGDFIKANGTTLGADNGIAVAMMLAILADKSLCHPPIEAVFTVDEEIGMLGAMALDMKLLKGKRMINMDSEDQNVVTVSCAGGSDFKAEIPLKRKKVNGTLIKLAVKGLKGGHSGVEINSGRINANLLMSRILNKLLDYVDFELVSINGGDKSNAIPLMCTAEVVTSSPELLTEKAASYADIVKDEIYDREPGFLFDAKKLSEGLYDVTASPDTRLIIKHLLCVPNGVIDMSMQIHGLVETSLNLGILTTEDTKITEAFALRSNKSTALIFLEEKLCAYFSGIPCSITTGGHYPPWEYKSDSMLQKLYCEKFKNTFGTEPKIEAIHAGLECGVFASAIRDFDCISIGPEMHGIHTVNEKLSVSSTASLYKIIIELLADLR